MFEFIMNQGQPCDSKVKTLIYYQESSFMQLEILSGKQKEAQWWVTT